MGYTLTNDEFQKRLQYIRNEGKDIYTNDVYVNRKTPLNFYCSKGHTWLAKPGDVMGDHTGCPYCSNRKVLIGFNDLWTTNPDIAVLLKNPEHGYLYVSGSNKCDDFECPNCHHVVKKQIQHMCTRGFTCNCCGDGVSYPNKFARALLKQIKCEQVFFEWSPDWLKPYKYDNYFVYNGKQYVLEMDGNRGHGNNDSYEYIRKSGMSGRDLDNYKDSLAIQHNIYVIRIDCAYHDTYKRDEYIINNIFNSDLAHMIDLLQINWYECNVFAESSMVVSVSKLYNDGLSVWQIAEYFNISRTTVKNWLKRGEKLGLNSYTISDSRERGRQTRKDIRRNISVNQYTLNGDFIRHFVSLGEAGRSIDCASGVFSYHKKRGEFEFIYHDFLWKINC